MKREYAFTISRTDRIYLVSFVLVLLSWELIKYFIPKTTFNEIWKSEIALANLDGSSSRDTLKTTYQQQKANNATNRKSVKSDIIIHEEIAPINIMESDLEELLAVGFQRKVAYTIIKYKDAGGKIKNQNDVLKIYGMDSSQWNKVMPYILFPEKEEIKMTENTYIPNRFLPKHILDLNTANAIDLDSLPGIGSVFADRIIKFRTSLGGFHKVEQIKSCYGIPPETIEGILPFITIVEPIKQQNVNQINWKTFQHPYMDKKYSPMILAYKNNHGPFQTLEDFRNVFPPDTSWCEPLLPYLTFGKE